MQSPISWSLLILVWSHTGTFAEQLQGTECDMSYGSELTQQIQVLERKLSRIQSLVLNAPIGPTETKKEGTVWKGNQSTLGYFKRLSNDAKQKLVEFHLENCQDLDVSVLLDELRPCTNLESLKLHHVELIGQFPNKSSARLTLPRLHEYEVVLDNYPDIRHDKGFDSIFVQKGISERELRFKQLFELQANIKVIIMGNTKLLINHDVGELVAEVNSGIQIPKSFKCKKLTLDRTVDLDSLQIPSDLTYLNAYIVQRDVIWRPRTEFNDFVKRLTNLKVLHLGVQFHSDFNTPIELSDLPMFLEHVSLVNLRLNCTGLSPSVHFVKTILFKGCIIDEKIIDTIYMQFKNLEKLAIIFHFVSQSQRQCHNFLYTLVTGETYLRKLEEIFVSRCDRYYELSKNKPKHYSEMEEFLTNLGLGKSERFYLRRQKGNTGDWVWSGRNATLREEKLIYYEFQDQHKLKTLETYAKD